MKRRTLLSLAALAVALALVAAGCGGGGADLGRQVEDPPTTSGTGKAETGNVKVAAAYVAQAIVPQFAVYHTPGAAAPAQQLANPWVVGPDYPDQTVPRCSWCKEQRKDGWVQVLLPVRPEREHRLGAGDRRAAHRQHYHVKVELGAPRSPSPERSGDLHRHVAVGADDTPTPSASTPCACYS